MKEAKFSRAPIGLILALLLNGCGGSNVGGTSTGNPMAEDASISGSAAGAVGGALSASGAGGQDDVLRLFAYRSARFQANAVACPALGTSSGSACAASGSTVWLSYNSCLTKGDNVKSGYMAAIMSSGSASCGSFPNPGANGSLIRQYVTAASSMTPAAFSITNTYGTSIVVDDATSNLGNFNTDAIAPLVSGGYGSSVGFSSLGLRASVTIAHRIYVTGRYNHSIAGTLAVSENSTTGQMTVTGQLTTYDNKIQVESNTAFSSVVYDKTCCLPVSGTVTSTFSQASNVAPTPAGLLTLGRSETLSFTGCGTATLTSASGTTETVSLTRCY